MFCSVLKCHKENFLRYLYIQLTKSELLSSVLFVYRFLLEFIKKQKKLNVNISTFSLTLYPLCKILYLRKMLIDVAVVRYREKTPELLVSRHLKIPNTSNCK